MGKRIAVRYMVLPGIKKGVSGFYANPKDTNCVEPNKPYEDSVCHTIGDEVGYAGVAGWIQDKRRICKRAWREVLPKCLWDKAI
ncbi:hypothetical protein QMA09_07685 [Planococcus sp. APC 3906]|uniref:hypothetical protein n=1 Tax=Planococcus sp. APC 3906 TaxID=3035194 RepID=UPI0025B5488F|nr:hypothetical protein [Planococcus sp. APC 3906]MDN3450068.1 hypothetical protein [Planococcus sp. APC 3906]